MRKTGEPTSTTESDSSLAARPDEGFLGRWSRRKRATAVDVHARAAAPTEESDEPLPASAKVNEAANPQLDTPPAGDGTAAPVLTDADMPAIESLGDDDDYSGFMSAGVSEELRQKALRRLFRSSQFNVLDGLNDYDDDFTNFEPLGDIITSDMRHRMEEEAKRAAEKLREDAAAIEQTDADASPPQLDGASDDEVKVALESSEQAQQVDELATGDGVGVDVDEPVATRTDANDARPRSAEPEDEVGESSSAIEISQSDARDV